MGSMASGSKTLDDKDGRPAPASKVFTSRHPEISNRDLLNDQETAPLQVLDKTPSAVNVRSYILVGPMNALPHEIGA